MSRLAELGIDRMSRAERLALAREILDSLIDEDEPGASLTDAGREELRRRLADCRANPDDVVPWEQVKADSVARWGE